MKVYEEAATLIVKEQTLIIGPLACDQASKIEGIIISESGEVHISGDPKIVLTNLVKIYSEFFGHASIEVCKEAITSIKKQIPPQELPDILK